MSASILEDRDVNASMQPTSPAKKDAFKTAEGAENNNKDPKSMEYHRQAFENRLKEDEGKAPTYVSPSDAIMSPASQKLSSFKQRQMTKGMGSGVKSRSLFAKAMSTREKDLGPIAKDSENVQK